MRIVLTIFFLFSVAYGQNIYHVKNGGNDALDGLSDATAWATISKVNSFSFASGDSVLLKNESMWNERLIVPNSNINFGSYSTGDKPLITGLQTVTGFTQSGNIWTKAVSTVSGLNMVLINGQVAHKGRYPNSTYLTYTSKTLSSLSTSLTGTPDYTGAIAVVRTAPWILDLSTVTSQSGGTLNLSPNLTYGTYLYSNGYFFQGLASFVDTTNEYNYDGTTLTVYSTTTPIVQISNIDTLVWISKKPNVTFDGISFTGANKAAIQIDTSRLITVQNCSINYSGTLAISALKSSILTVINDSIQNSLSGAIYGRQLDYYTTAVNQCDSAIITGNVIKRTGALAGMGLGGNARYNAMDVQGLNLGPYIVGNTVDSSGYNGIEFWGKKSIIRNNIVSNFCFVKDDGGGIRTVIGSYLDSAYNDSSIVNSNIVYNGIGAAAGAAAAQANGIYFDNNSRRITADSNTVYNCVLGGIFLHQNTQITAQYNNLYSNGADLKMADFNDGATNIIFKHNSLFANSGSPLIDGYPFLYSISNLGTFDSNFYYNPSSNKYIYKGGTNAANYFYYNLSEWLSYSSQDTHTQIKPTLATTSIPTLLINSTFYPVTSDLVGSYIANGNSFNYITLQPTSSVMMFKSSYNTFNNYPLRFKKITQ